MRIALVDDCPNDLSIMRQFLAEALDTDSVITEFHNGEDFLQHWSADTFDLIVLDIYMEQLTGIEIARVIRETDPNVCLVFATTSNEFASESYEVNACYYLCKPFLKQQVLAMLDRIGQQNLEVSRTVLLPNGEKVLLRSIIYADYASHRVTLHCKKDETITLRVPFQEIEQLLCHYSYFYSPCKGIIVNFYEVCGQSGTVFSMSDGSLIPISRRKSADVLCAYSSFCFDKIRKEMS